MIADGGFTGIHRPLIVLSGLRLFRFYASLTAEQSARQLNRKTTSTLFVFSPLFYRTTPREKRILSSAE